MSCGREQQRQPTFCSQDYPRNISALLDFKIIQCFQRKNNHKIFSPQGVMLNSVLQWWKSWDFSIHQKNENIVRMIIHAQLGFHQNQFVKKIILFVFTLVPLLKYVLQWWPYWISNRHKQNRYIVKKNPSKRIRYHIK